MLSITSDGLVLCSNARSAVSEYTCMWPRAGNGIELGENYDEIAESLLKE